MKEEDISGRFSSKIESASERDFTLYGDRDRFHVWNG
jgi:hypothetical protein